MFQRRRVREPAGFSAGPQPREEGGTGANRIALLNVPGLVVQGGARDTQPTLVTNFSPTSRENLLAAARVVARTAPNVAGGVRARRTRWRPTRGLRAGWCTASRSRCRM